MDAVTGEGLSRGSALRRWALVGLVALAGCGGGAYDLPRVGGGLPEVTMRASRAWDVPPGRGDTSLVVRSFTAAADGTWTEVAGATCEVTGAPFFSATLTTPARVVLPDLAAEAPSLQAICSTATGRGSDTVAPVYDLSGDNPAVDVFTRARYGGGWWRGFEKSGPLSYPDLAVGLQPSAP